MRFLFRIGYLFNCFVIRRGHYFCPWYRPESGEIGVVKRRCRDCGTVDSRTVSYDVWSSVERENICL